MVAQILCNHKEGFEEEVVAEWISNNGLEVDCVEQQKNVHVSIMYHVKHELIKYNRPWARIISLRSHFCSR